MVSKGARPGVRSTFGPVPLAYGPELKARFADYVPSSLRNAIFLQTSTWCRVAELKCTPRAPSPSRGRIDRVLRHQGLVAHPPETIACRRHSNGEAPA